jgi:hypothetical protein
LPAGSLSSRSAVIPVEHAPSMEHFMVHYLLPPGAWGHSAEFGWAENCNFDLFVRKQCVF